MQTRIKPNEPGQPNAINSIRFRLIRVDAGYNEYVRFGSICIFEPIGTRTKPKLLLYFSFITLLINGYSSQIFISVAKMTNSTLAKAQTYPHIKCNATMRLIKP